MGNDIPGEKKILIGLTQIRGIGYTFANAIIDSLGIDPNSNIGYMTDSNVQDIEKIIQIPYQVRPIQPDALDVYLRAQMEVQIDQVEDDSPDQLDQLRIGGLTGGETGGTEILPLPVEISSDLPPEVIKFPQEEYRSLEWACEHISNLSPRSIKRLVNVFKAAALRHGSRPARSPPGSRKVHRLATRVQLPAVPYSASPPHSVPSSPRPTPSQVNTRLGPLNLASAAIALACAA